MTSARGRIFETSASRRGASTPQWPTRTMRWLIDSLQFATPDSRLQNACEGQDARYIAVGTRSGRAMGKGTPRSAIVTAVTFLLAAGGGPRLFAAQQNATWLGGTGGWTDPTKWST